MPIRSRRRQAQAASGHDAPKPPIDPATGRAITPDAQPHISSVLEDHERDIVEAVRFYTMVSPERLVANIDAVKYVVQRGIPGAIVECGVWRGGSTLSMIKTLQYLGVDDRDVYLYDTFEGMTPPGESDTSPFERSALETWNQTPSGTKPWEWAMDPEIYSIDFVRQVMTDSGYPQDRIHLVKGPVESTIPGTVPDQIAVARLDTDWYESTMHELVHFYPRMPAGAVLIIDDFGHWDGARRAVEEYFSKDQPPIFFGRTDYTGRVGIKS